MSPRHEEGHDALWKRAEAEADRKQQRELGALGAWGRALQRDVCGAWTISGTRGKHTQLGRRPDLGDLGRLPFVAALDLDDERRGVLHRHSGRRGRGLPAAACERAQHREPGRPRPKSLGRERRDRGSPRGRGERVAGADGSAARSCVSTHRMTTRGNRSERTSSLAGRPTTGSISEARGFAT